MSFYAWLRILVWGLALLAIIVGGSDLRVGLAAVIAVNVFETFAAVERRDCRRCHPSARTRRR